MVSADEYARTAKLIGRTPTSPSSASSRDVERALLVQILEDPSALAADQGALGDPGARRERRRHRHRRRARVVFKMESHNHPSYIEPTRCATGVGGILRDVFIMVRGRSPASMPLSLGRRASEDATSGLCVVAGVGGYGNSFGVPTVGGSVRFHTRYDGNCLSIAMAVGLAETTRSSTRRPRARMPIVYLAPRLAATASTAHQGVGGVRGGNGGEAPDRAVGDPFSEKLLLEPASRSWEDCVIAIQTWARQA